MLNPKGAVIHDTAKINNAQFGRFSKIDERVRVTDSYVGDYSYILHDSEIIYTEIGKFCAIAPFTRINPGNHPFWKPAMSNFTYRSEQYGFGPNDQTFFDERRKQTVKIGHDVWIGQDVLVMPGVSVGNGAVVGGGAVVTKSIAPYTIVAGVPAKKIKKRFEDKIIKSLLRICWWDWSHSEIKDAIPDFRNKKINDFCKKYDPFF